MDLTSKPFATTGVTYVKTSVNLVWKQGLINFSSLCSLVHADIAYNDYCHIIRVINAVKLTWKIRHSKALPKWYAKFGP